jgi:hypothetical protein
MEAIDTSGCRNGGDIDFDILADFLRPTMTPDE